jgi:uncharacterized membrane protein
VALALLGLVDSGYLIWYDVASQKGICSLTGFFGCSTILDSSYARVGGIPTALFGFVWSAVVILLAMRVANDGEWIKYLLPWSILGALGVAALMYIELIRLGAICPFCTAAHILGLAILGLTVSLWRQSHSNRD